MHIACGGDGFANEAIFFYIEMGFVAVSGFLFTITTLFDVVASLGILC